MQKTLKILSVFCVVTVLMESIGAYLGFNQINTMFLCHLYTPIEFAFIIFIVKSFYQNSTYFLPVLLFCFAAFCVFDSLFIESILHFNSIPRGIEGIIIICFCVYFFYHIFTSEETFNLTTYPYFWLFSSWLIYFSGTLILFVYSFQAGVNTTFSIIHSVLNILLNLIFAYTLWLGSKKLIG